MGGPNSETAFKTFKLNNMEPIDLVKAIKKVDDYSGVILLQNYIKKMQPKKNSDAASPPEMQEIMQYLNKRTGSNYTGKSKNHQSLVRMRLKEGFTVKDFKKVIDNMTSHWKGDPKMDSFLRPETLFNGKFESYLNTKTKHDQYNPRSARFI